MSSSRTGSPFSTVPAVVRLLVENPHPPPAALHLRVIKVGAALLTLALAEAARKRYGATVVRDYASSEGNFMLRSLPDTPAESVGQPYPDIAARIVDEQGEDVPEGGAGELIVRSPGVMRGYLHDPDTTARVLRDGWLWTGDLARRDTKGDYYLLGRTRLQINVAGQKVSPDEVERVLEQHPQIREAVVLAAADDTRGEVVRAVIVPRREPPTVRDLQRFCRERLADYKIPRLIEFRDELPRSPLGKVLRHLL